LLTAVLSRMLEFESLLALFKLYILMYIARFWSQFFAVNYSTRNDLFLPVKCNSFIHAPWELRVPNDHATTSEVISLTVNVLQIQISTRHVNIFARKNSNVDPWASQI
jgi:hypothetical protein